MNPDRWPLARAVATLDRLHGVDETRRWLRGEPDADELLEMVLDGGADAMCAAARARGYALLARVSSEIEEDRRCR
jgi:hypothetical protein